jgi:hypothetical protein
MAITEDNDLIASGTADTFEAAKSAALFEAGSQAPPTGSRAT